MDDDNRPQEPEGKEPHDRHWILWTVVVVFIIVAIAGMWSIDYFYAPEMISPLTVPDAVGK
ncbi:MAG: hypothetical protein ACM3X0_03570 [Bacteroidota bacterium]